MHQIRREKQTTISEVIVCISEILRKISVVFSFSASFKNSNPREKVAKLSSFWDWWAESLFVSIIVAKYNYIFSPRKQWALAQKTKRFAHAISVHYRDFEHAYVY